VAAGVGASHALAQYPSVIVEMRSFAMGKRKVERISR